MRTIQKAKPERENARIRGDIFYDTGRPCKKGHVSSRRVSDASCCRCREVDKARLESRAVQRRGAANRRAAEKLNDPVGYAERSARDKRTERARYPERVRERERLYGRLKRQRHPERKNAETRARQAAKLQRTPAWADLTAIRAFYEACPDGYEVDHVHPLCGKLVSGLHVLANLQYLSKEANRLKGSRFEPYSMRLD